MIRRFGNTPVKEKNYTLRTGVYAFLPGKGGLLVTHQSRPEPEYQLPGGGIDPGESPAQALHREVYEETGWRISDIRRLGAYRRFTYMPEYDLWAEKMCILFVARPTLRLGPPSEPDHTPLWMSYDEADILLANSGERDFLF